MAVQGCASTARNEPARMYVASDATGRRPSPVIHTCVSMISEQHAIPARGSKGPDYSRPKTKTDRKKKQKRVRRVCSECANGHRRVNSTPLTSLSTPGSHRSTNSHRSTESGACNKSDVFLKTTEKDPCGGPFGYTPLPLPVGRERQAWPRAGSLDWPGRTRQGKTKRLPVRCLL